MSNCKSGSVVRFGEFAARSALHIEKGKKVRTLINEIGTDNAAFSKFFPGKYATSAGLETVIKQALGQLKRKSIKCLAGDIWSELHFADIGLCDNAERSMSGLSPDLLRAKNYVLHLHSAVPSPKQMLDLNVL